MAISPASRAMRISRVATSDLKAAGRDAPRRLRASLALVRDGRKIHAPRDRENRIVQRTQPQRNAGEIDQIYEAPVAWRNGPDARYLAQLGESGLTRVTPQERLDTDVEGVIDRLCGDQSEGEWAVGDGRVMGSRRRAVGGWPLSGSRVASARTGN